MIAREDGLVEIYERIKEGRIALGIKTFRQTPTSPVREEDLPCVFMSEDVDNIVERSQRSPTGYPAKRVLEVIIEIVVDKSTNIKTLYAGLRRVIFMKRGTADDPVYDPIVADPAFINENRTEGPIGYGLPDVLGMRLVLDLVYTDNAF